MSDLTFTQSTMFRMHNPDYGFLEIPFPGIEGNEPKVTFKDDFVLEVLYTTLVSDKETTVKAFYRCSVIEFLRDSGVLDFEEHNPMHCDWSLVDHEIIEQDV